MVYSSSLFNKTLKILDHNQKYTIIRRQARLYNQLVK